MLRSFLLFGAVVAALTEAESDAWNPFKQRASAIDVETAVAELVGQPDSEGQYSFAGLRTLLDAHPAAAPAAFAALTATGNPPAGLENYMIKVLSKELVAARGRLKSGGADAVRDYAKLRDRAVDGLKALLGTGDAAIPSASVREEGQDLIMRRLEMRVPNARRKKSLAYAMRLLKSAGIVNGRVWPAPGQTSVRSLLANKVAALAKKAVPAAVSGAVAGAVAGAKGAKGPAAAPTSESVIPTAQQAVLSVRAAGALTKSLASTSPPWLVEHAFNVYAQTMSGGDTGVTTAAAMRRQLLRGVVEGLLRPALIAARPNVVLDWMLPVEPGAAMALALLQTGRCTADFGDGSLARGGSVIPKEAIAVAEGTAPPPGAPLGGFALTIDEMLVLTGAGLPQPSLDVLNSDAALATALKTCAAGTGPPRIARLFARLVGSSLWARWTSDMKGLPPLSAAPALDGRLKSGYSVPRWRKDRRVAALALAREVLSAAAILPPVVRIKPWTPPASGIEADVRPTKPFCPSSPLVQWAQPLWSPGALTSAPVSVRTKAGGILRLGFAQWCVIR